MISFLFPSSFFSLFAFPLLCEKGTHLYILKEPWCVLLLKINLFLSLGEKSIRLSSISVFPCVKQGNLLKTFLTMMSKVKEDNAGYESWKISKEENLGPLELWPLHIWPQDFIKIFSLETKSNCWVRYICD